MASLPARPNIVFILADDLGITDLSCYGSRDNETPAIDSLADDGLAFRQAYASAPVCSVTRLALMTGRYPQRDPAGLHEPLTPGRTALGLDPATPTLPKLLREAGYHTSLVGKWHLGAPPSYSPRKSGYDRFFGFYYGAADYFTHLSRARGERPHPFDGLFEDDRPVTRTGYLTTILAEEAANQISGMPVEKPFFLSLHFNAPHWPWERPGDAAVAASLRTLRHPGGGSVSVYREMVSALDAGVARVLQALAAKGVADNTLVVFTSDNGGERFSDSWPYVGMKGELLEGGLRVPALLRWPGGLGRGTVSDQVVVTMDWAPTLLKLAGATTAQVAFDGLDILPLVHSPRARQLYWRHAAHGQAAARDGSLKYLRLRGREYLFDLSADLRERADLRELRPRDFERLREAFAVWNAGMLPYRGDEYSESPRGELADRY